MHMADAAGNATAHLGHEPVQRLSESKHQQKVSGSTGICVLKWADAPRQS